MGSYAAAGHGVTHHQIVQAGVRDEIEPGQQGIGFGEPVIERLHQQRPFGFGQALEISCLEWAVVELPARTASLDEARLDLVAAGQVLHFPGR